MGIDFGRFVGLIFCGGFLIWDWIVFDWYGVLVFFDGRGIIVLLILGLFEKVVEVGLMCCLFCLYCFLDCVWRMYDFGELCCCIIIVGVYFFLWYIMVDFLG